MNVGEILNVQLLYDILRVSTPLILLALAGAISDRGGVLNIALEGLLLFGAFAGVLATGLTRSLVVGVAAAMLAGVLLALVFAWFAIFLRANLFIVGLATNSFAAAVTTYASWLIAASRLPTRSISAPQSGWKCCVVLFSIQLAKPSLSHRSSHHAMVTRSPNH